MKRNEITGDRMTSMPVIYTKLFLTACLWGATFVAARVVAQHVPPFTASFLRFAVASVFLVLIMLKLEGRLPALRKNQLVHVVLLGMTGIFAYNAFFFLGLKTVAASRASLIVACNPVFISLFAAWIFRERMTAGKLLGIVLCLIGAAIVITRGNPLEILQGRLGRGELYILGCVASWVAYSLLGKQVMKDLSPPAAVTWSCLIGAAMLLFPALWEGFPSHLFDYAPADWAGLFYLGFFGTVLGFIWYYEGIKAIGPSRAGVFINFVPVSGVCLGWLLLGEPINLSLILGAVLVIGGVMLTNRVKTP